MAQEHNGGSGERRGHYGNGNRRGNGHYGKGRGPSRPGRGGKGGFRKDGRKDFHKGPRRDWQPREDGERCEWKDGERREEGRRPFRKGDGFRKERDGRKDFHKDGKDFRKDFHKDGEHRPFRRDERQDDRREEGRKDFHKGPRREFSPEEKRQHCEAKREEYMSRPRRNSDGTMSFPSQNPYTDRRPDEPRMPKGLTWSMLSKDERERLRGLSKEHAENVGLHILAAYTLIDDEPKAALEHAQWAARQASRIDFAREVLAFVAYRCGNYKLALREFRTAHRMNGYPDYLPFIADCERGLGQPKKAIEVALSDDAKLLRGDAKAEMFLVYAGALADLEHWDKAIAIAHTLGTSKGISGGYRMRALQAEQNFLEEAGRTDEAMRLDGLIERLEDQYADFDEDEESDDVVIDHDLESLVGDEDELAELGITEEDAQWAPDDDEAGADADADPAAPGAGEATEA